MAAVANKDTVTELLVRSALHRLGYRFRLHVKHLPGTPDIILPRHRLCIFVHGCFWHQHPGCKRATIPASNSSFWETKFSRNINRDILVRKQLEASGWRVCVIWGCDVQKPDRLFKAINRCQINPQKSTGADN
jgi:DNA mismatch endonuclease (patch repair protein)